MPLLQFVSQITNAVFAIADPSYVSASVRCTARETVRLPLSKALQLNSRIL